MALLYSYRNTSYIRLVKLLFRSRNYNIIVLIYNP
jgi:hypothetical protein